jgi:hypothetical protein
MKPAEFKLSTMFSLIMSEIHLFGTKRPFDNILLILAPRSEPDLISARKISRVEICV